MPRSKEATAKKTTKTAPKSPKKTIDKNAARRRREDEIATAESDPPAAEPNASKSRGSLAGKRLWSSRSSKSSTATNSSELSTRKPGTAADVAAEDGSPDKENRKKNRGAISRSKAKWYQTSDRLPVSKNTVKKFLKSAFLVLKKNGQFGEDFEAEKLSIGEKALGTVTRAYVYYIGRLLGPARAFAERDFLAGAKKGEGASARGFGIVKTVKSEDLDAAFELVRTETGPSWGRTLVRVDVVESDRA